MLRGVSGNYFGVKLIETEKDRGIPLYIINGIDYDDSLRFEDNNFEAIDELIELLEAIKQNNIR